MGDVGVRAGLVETCALGTTQALREACRSLGAQGNLSIVVEPSPPGVQLSSVYLLAVPSAHSAVGAFYSSRGELQLSPPVTLPG